LGDLKAAKSFGLRTIYVKREGEDREATEEDKEYVDMVADDFVDAARKLGIQNTGTIH
jgi:methionine salvage enolase-phosphatase E1